MHAAQYTAPNLDCPRKGCGAKSGEPCRDRSGRLRSPHAPRLQESHSSVNPPSSKQWNFILGLRRELGIKTEEMPATSKQANFVIKALLARQAAAKRDAERVELAPPQRKTYRVADGSQA
jgi:hypothetical protein